MQQEQEQEEQEQQEQQEHHYYDRYYQKEQISKLSQDPRKNSRVIVGSYRDKQQIYRWILRYCKSLDEKGMSIYDTSYMIFECAYQYRDRIDELELFGVIERIQGSRENTKRLRITPKGRLVLSKLDSLYSIFQDGNLYVKHYS